MISMFPLFEYVKRSSSVPEDIKIIFIVNQIFHVLDFLRSLIQLRKKNYKKLKQEA